jgi:hypothetical protein
MHVYVISKGVGGGKGREGDGKLLPGVQDLFNTIYKKI